MDWTERTQEPDLGGIYNRFACEGTFVTGAPYGHGHINDTFQIVVDRHGKPARYILQRINHYVFREVEDLMDNIARVCAHAWAKLQEQGCDEPERRSLKVVPTKAGGTFFMDSEGCYWRVYDFIECAKGYDKIGGLKQAYEAARAFGEFQKLLTDMPGERLHETIPDFHNTRKRMDVLKQAVSLNTFNRAKLCGREIDWAFEHAGLASSLLDQFEQGLMPERVTHNDTKLNNVLIDDSTNEAVCVIDLDTIMPGLALYDFGDLVRSSTNSAGEDEKDMTQIVVQIDVFDALVKGYLSAARDCLTTAELASLPVSGMVMTFECGVRFLTDYLSGDVYFKTLQPDQNLSRCRAQFALVESMEQQRDAMARCVESAM